jgi:hypothetical protein
MPETNNGFRAGMVGGVVGSAAVKESEVAREINKTSAEASDLLALMGELQMRLSPLVRSVPEKSNNDTATPGLVTDVARAVFNINEKVSRANQELRSLLSRLEI